jgi:hypothetical protein
MGCQFGKYALCLSWKPALSNTTEYPSNDEVVSAARRISCFDSTAYTLLTRAQAGAGVKIPRAGTDIPYGIRPVRACPEYRRSPASSGVPGRYRT